MRKLLVILAIAAALTNFMTLSASATGIPNGSTVTFTFTDFPQAGPIATTFGGGPTISGNLEIYDFSVGTPGGGVWDYFHVATTDGSPIGVSPSADWSVTMNYLLSQAVYFDGAERQWLLGTAPTPAAPLTSWGSGLTPIVGPLGPGYGGGYGTTGAPFSALLPAGPETSWREVFVNPYSSAASNGVSPAATGYYFAYHFQPVPAPSALLLLGPGLAGLAAVRKRFKK
jgi:hypothetical protein